MAHMLHDVDLDSLGSLVNRPGKFEGEPLWVPYFYDQSMNGDGVTIDLDESWGSSIEAFQVDAEESEAFNLPIGSWIVLEFCSNGFVFGHQAPIECTIESQVRDWWMEVQSK